MHVLPATYTAPPRWLGKLGFRFDPFEHLEASTDPHLSEYFVDHDLFSLAWNDAPALVFAPPGGGKTATRIASARACWVGRGGVEAFPIPYLLYSSIDRSPDQHRQRIAEQGAAALLLGILHRPALLLVRDRSDQSDTLALIDDLLPYQIERCIDQLRSGETPQSIGTALLPGYAIPPSEEPFDPEPVCRMLEQTVSGQRHPSEGDSFDRLLALLFNTFRFRSVLLQIDGVDATPGTVDDPRAMTDSVHWLLSQAQLWASKRIVIKAFLPAELEEHLRDIILDLTGFQLGHLRWTTSLLVELIQQRVRQASNGNLETLDAKAVPVLQDVETQLAQLALPLPREVLFLTSLLLQAYDERTAGRVGLIEALDIAEAHHRYDQHQVDPAALLR